MLKFTQFFLKNIIVSILIVELYILDLIQTKLQQ